MTINNGHFRHLTCKFILKSINRDLFRKAKWFLFNWPLYSVLIWYAPCLCAMLKRCQYSCHRINPIKAILTNLFHTDPKMSFQIQCRAQAAMFKFNIVGICLHWLGASCSENQTFELWNHFTPITEWSGIQTTIWITHSWRSHKCSWSEYLTSPLFRSPP